MDDCVKCSSTSGERDDEDIKKKSRTLKSALVISPGRSISNKKKLLVLDLNGLLADIVYSCSRSNRAVFKRPYCDDFIDFCFERFEVGIWSSKIRKNVDLVVDYLLGTKKHKLLFSWDATNCTSTKCNTLENKNKPIVFKELIKLWDKYKGQYNESNTLLLDDTPYKALLNPPYTAIFPCSYKYLKKDDNLLGGDLRVYLEALAAAADVPNFVKQNPFGQEPITPSSDDWRFYFQVICSLYN